MALGGVLDLVWSPCSGPLLAPALTPLASERGLVRGGVVPTAFRLDAAIPLVAVACVPHSSLSGVRDWVLSRIERERHGFALSPGAMGVAILTRADNGLEARVLQCLSESRINLTIGTQETVMTLLKLTAVLALLGLALIAQAADGLLAAKSPHSVQDTMNRLEAAVKERGLNVFARIDHAAGATKVGRILRPTEVLIFGSPQGGTPLMECAQTTGIDLPLKALVWQDESAQVWLGYNDPAFLAQRHGVPACPAVETLRKALTALAEAAVAR